MSYAKLTFFENWTLFPGSLQMILLVFQTENEIKKHCGKFRLLLFSMYNI
jgi:hypothetical protein